METEAELKNLICQLRQSVSKAPEGRLVITSSRNHFYFFQKTENEKMKIDKKNEALIKKLAQKEYDTSMLQAAEKRLDSFQKYEKIKSDYSFSDIFKNLHPEIKSRVVAYYKNIATVINDWKNIKFEGKPFEKDVPFFFTDNNEKVRSKSEVLIANKLKSLGIPYKYEFPLKLKEFGTVYPDFTVISPKTGTVFIIEHFGMMDELNYATSALKKINSYADNGYIIGKNLIVLFESQLVPLNTKTLNNTLAEMIL